MKSILIIILFSGIVFSARSQITVTGEVTNKKTKEYLPFVNVIYHEKYGTTTNLDGTFKFFSKTEISKLNFRYLGFKDTTIFIDNTKKNIHLYISLEKENYAIDEVVIYPGENPAHRIIKEVVKNRKINNPEKNLKSFSYTSYNKFVGTFNQEEVLLQDSVYHAGKDSIKQVRNDTLLQAGKTLEYIARIDSVEKAKIDSVRKVKGFYSLKEFTDIQYLMLMENVSNRKFKYPNKNAEKIIASRVSGLKDPSFFLLTTELQSFTFYEDFITLDEKVYLNPISKGSAGKYLFVIEDTTYTTAGDSVFTISFRPRKNKNFEGLKGTLKINTNSYSIQSVIAEPYVMKGLIGLKVQQNYEYINNKQWFPIELNTVIIFNKSIMPSIKGLGKMPNLIYTGKTYLSNIKLNPVFEKKDFMHKDIELVNDAGRKDSIFWNEHRKTELSAKDKRTYRVIDSLGEATNLDLKINVLKSVVSGYIPYKIIDIDIRKLFTYNNYEGFRPGFGFVTNKSVSRYLSLGGYVGYGFKDKQFKYGGEFNISPLGNEYLIFNFSYKNDVFETGGIDFFDDRNIFSSENQIKYLINKMYNFEEMQLNLYSHKISSLKINLFAKKSLINNEYIFVSDTITTNVSCNLSEAGVQMKFSPNVKYQRYLGEKIIMTQKDPIFWLNLSKGIQEFGGEYDYIKITAKVSESFQTKLFGKTNIQIRAGCIFGEVPYVCLFNGHGSYKKFAVETENSFNTMRMNEFISDRFASLFFKQDFSSLLFKTKKYAPEISFITNVGWGELSNDYNNYLNSETLEKVYYESGILIDHIISLYDIIGLGAGVFYRYGSYKLPDEIDNFAFKFSLSLRL